MNIKEIVNIMWKMEGNVLVKQSRSNWMDQLNISEIARYYRELGHPSNSDGRTTRADRALKVAQVFDISPELVVWCASVDGVAGRSKPGNKRK